MDVAIAAVLVTGVWRFQDLFPILARVQFPLVSTAAVLWLVMMSRSPTPALLVLRHPVMRLSAFLIFLMFLSVPGSLYPGLSLQSIVKDHARDAILMLVIAVSGWSLRAIERIVLVQVVGALVFATMVWLRFPLENNGRLGDLGYYDANDMAMLMVCTVPLAVYFVRKSAGTATRMMAVGALAVFVLSIMRTGSRAGFLGLIAVSAFILFRYTALSKKARWGTVVAAMLMLFVVASDSYWSLMRTLLNPTQDYNWAGNAESGRMEVWKRGMGYMWSHPLTGVGVNAFPVAEGEISPLAERQGIGVGLKWSAAHNSFVQIGAELGVAGLVLFVWLLWRAWKVVRDIGRLPRQVRWMLPSETALAQSLGGVLVGYVICAFFLSQAYSALLYTSLGLIVALGEMVKRQLREVQAAGWPASAYPVNSVRRRG